jgi:hypothetical protein
LDAFYILNLTVAVALIFAPLWWSVRLLEQPWINPVTIPLAFVLPVEVFKLFIGQIYLGDGLMSPSYQFAVLMTNLQQTIALIIIFIASRLRITRKLPSIIPLMGTYQLCDFRRFYRIFFLFYAIAFLLLAIKTGGLGAWLSDIRGSYIEKRDGNGVFYAAAVSFLSISYFFKGIYSQQSLKFALHSLFFFGAIYILGSKGFILQFIIFFMIILLRQGQVNIKRQLLLGLPFALGLMLVNFTSQQESFEFTSVAEYFNYYPNAAMYYQDYFLGQIRLFEGKIFLTSFYEYLPRALFPDKPYVYGILHVVELYYPGGAESGNTPAFYGGVQQFADFGIAGVIFFSLFNWTPLVYFAALRYALKERAFMNQGPMTGRTIIISLLLFAPAFGTFLPIFMLIALLLFVVGIIKCIKLTSRCLIRSG